MPVAVVPTLRTPAGPEASTPAWRPFANSCAPASEPPDLTIHASGRLTPCMLHPGWGLLPLPTRRWPTRRARTCRARSKRATKLRERSCPTVPPETRLKQQASTTRVRLTATSRQRLAPNGSNSRGSCENSHRCPARRCMTYNDLSFRSLRPTCPPRTLSPLMPVAN